MALLVRIYYNAVFGALGGLLGWMLFGVLGNKNPSPGLAHFLNMVLGGGLIGGAIGYFVVSVDALRDRSLGRFARLATYGLLLGAIGGAFGMFLGDEVNYRLVNLIGSMDRLPVGSAALTILARGIGWTFLGMAIGMSEGIAARSLGKFSYGTIGGALGGFGGGCLFGLFYEIAKGSLSTTYFWNGMGLVILGAAIGALSAFVQGVFQPASVKVMRGWQEGREYPLDRPANSLGRAEDADIALFRDMKVEKKHAFVKRVDGRYILYNNGAPPEWTRVNEAPVPQARELQDGDRIQLGNVILKFQARAAQNRARPPRPLPYASSGSPRK